MNDIEKAIEKYKEFIKDNPDASLNEIRRWRVVISVLEKQMPKKVTSEGRNLPEGTAYCPSCGAFLSIYHKYCFNCGQALEDTYEN